MQEMKENQTQEKTQEMNEKLKWIQRLLQEMIQMNREPNFYNVEAKHWSKHFINKISDVTIRMDERKTEITIDDREPTSEITISSETDNSYIYIYGLLIYLPSWITEYIRQEIEHQIELHKTIWFIDNKTYYYK